MKKIIVLLCFCIAVTVFSAEIQLLKNDFNRSPGSWMSPGYWGGKISRVTENNRKFLELTATEKGKRYFARAYGYCKQVRFFPDMLIRIKVRVKGEGKFNTGILLYTMGTGAPSGYLRSREISLTGEFQDFETTLRLDQCMGKVLPIMEIQGRGKAVVESFSMKTASVPENSIAPCSAFQIVSKAEDAQEVKFLVNTSGKKFFITEINGKNVVTRTGKGSGEISFKAQNLLPGMNEIIVSANGVSASLYIEVNKEYAVDKAIAEKIKLDRKIKCLFLGDSLTEFYPGRNYFARLNFWLNKYNPGKVELVNAGVGGDFITRVAQRLDAELTGKGAAYRQKVYKGIFKSKYDYIFIWLGHNDTVTSRINKYGKFARPQVTPEVQEKTFSSVLTKLQKLNPKAKIILISPSPSDVKKFESYDKRFSPQRQIHMFGKKEFVAAFDAVNRKLVKQFDLAYIEMNAAMSSQPDLAALYVEDGVHLSHLGGRIAAREILRAFACGFRGNGKRTAAVAPIVKKEHIPEYELQVKLTGNNFKKSLHSWNSPGYWPGKVTSVTEENQKFLQLTSGLRGKEEFARAHGYCKNISLYPGMILQIKVRVKGEGKFNTGIICYPWQSDAQGKYVRGKEITLRNDFQYLTDFIVLSEKYSKILPIMEIQGKGRAQVEFFEMHSCIDPAVKLETLSTMQVIGKAADAREVLFKTRVPGGKVILSTANSKKAAVTELETGEKLSVKPENLHPGINEITVAAGGKKASAFIDVNSEFDTDDRIAWKIRLDRKINVLFIGGSHCEFYPGQNFISRLGFWFEKYNPGKVQIFNHGVAGDFITRVEQRLNARLTGKDPAWRQSMYQTIFDQQYDYIFMFLGQNDTVTSRISKYGKFARPQVTPDVQEKSYRRVFDILFKKSPGAKIVLMSPSPSYVKLFEDYDKRFKPGRQIHMFGKKEFLDAYVAVNRKLARELKFDCIDTLDTMRQYPDLRSLYVEDGVHLTPRGGMVVAREILKYFSAKAPKEQRVQEAVREKANVSKKIQFPLFQEELSFYHSFDKSLTADLSNGKGNPLVGKKNPRYVPGLHGSALFCGKNGGTFLRFPRKNNLDFDVPGTVVFFYKPLKWEADLNKKYPRLFWFGVDSAKGCISFQGANDPKTLCMCQRALHVMFLYGKRIPNKVYVLPSVGKAGCEEKWHMFAFSWAGNKLYLKWNDQRTKVIEHPAGVRNSDFPADYFSFGATETWNYLLDDFMIYSRRLSDSELDQLFAAAKK